MARVLPPFRSFKYQSARQITITSLAALVLGHIMINTYFPSELLNFAGLIITSWLIYQFTLRKNDLFSFIMVIYFCSTFPYLAAKGGAFNLVSFVCIVFYYLNAKKFPGEIKIRDPLFKMLITLFVFSSLLGWIFNYTGKGIDIVYSFITFFGVISLLLLSGRLEITRERIKVFLQVNFILIGYSTIASINKYLHFIPFNTPMMPISGRDSGYFEGGGLVGNSPLYGEHSLILLILFSVFLIIPQETNILKKSNLIGAVIIAYINIFMSVSRSVFLLSIAGLTLLILFQFNINRVKVVLIIKQLLFIVLFGGFVLFIVKLTGIGNVFYRLEDIEKRNTESGGVTINHLLDGSAFNREIAFAIAKERYESKDSWWIGYGWGLPKNNRDAWFVDPNILRISPHSQIFNVLFLFGWIGSIAYWGLIFRLIYCSYRTCRNKKTEYSKRYFAYFFMLSFILFIFNEIKADSLYSASYFAVTIIWMGLAFSVNNQNNIETRPQLNHVSGRYSA